MRALAFVCLVLASPALAETVPATSRITAVTVYPYGAEITREVAFTAPAGSHELLVTDLPAGTEPNLIRLSAEGLGLGAFALRTDRLPPRDEALTPAQEVAKAEVERLETALRTAEAAIAAIEARVSAAEAQAAFLAGAKAEGSALTPEGLAALAQTVGTGVLAAKEAALAARAGLPAAQKAQNEARKALDKALAAEAALDRPDENYVALSVALTTAQPGDHSLTVTHFVADASWQPVYDLMLTRKDGNRLTIGRGVLVSQSTGEDWAGVNLTLSTAQPAQQAEPSVLYPELRRLSDPESSDSYRSEDMAVGSGAPMAEAAPVEEVMVTAEAAMQGDVVVYRYPSAVDVASGVENLRLALDEIALEPEIEARAIPRYDRTAFVLARFTNTSGEILLPGQAFLMREGTLVGATWITGIAPGAEAEVAFGAIEGLQLTRDMPVTAEGDRGILSSSTQREEVAVLKVKNLTDETWPVRLMDLVPYSEQEELEITFSADPAPSETDADAQRGILAWEFDIAPGEDRQITLTHTLRWPEGMVVQ